MGLPELAEQAVSICRDAIGQIKNDADDAVEEIRNALNGITVVDDDDVVGYE